MTYAEMDDIYNEMSKEEMEKNYALFRSQNILSEQYPAHLLAKGKEELKKFKKLIEPLKNVYIKFPDETPEYFYEMKKAEAEVIYTIETAKDETDYYDPKIYQDATDFFYYYILDEAKILYGFLSLKSNYPLEYQIEQTEVCWLHKWLKKRR